MLKQQDNRITRADRKAPFGPRMEWIDYLRGWKDDFFGDSIHEQYTLETTGAPSSGSLQDGLHGGVYRLTSENANNRYARLWLGDAADGHDTLDADLGWVQIARIRLNNIVAGNFEIYIGVINVARNRYMGMAKQHPAIVNWVVRCRDVGGVSFTDSGIAIDTDWHWHVMDVYPIAGGRRVDYYLDGGLVASQTTNVPTEVLTPIIVCRSGSAVTRSVDVDYWAVIPRNL